jgi:predicted acetyltransferase
VSLRFRHPTVDELPAMMRTLGAAFLEASDPVERAAFIKDYWDLERVWGALDDERIVGTLRTWPTTITLPGLATLPASAIAGVTVLPTHTRRGALRGMLEAELDASRGRGEALALLYASEWAIYGRFGFGAAVETAIRQLDVRGIRFVGPAPAGAVEYVERADAEPVIRPIFEAHVRQQPGAITRLARRWELDLGRLAFPGSPPWAGWVIIHRATDGTPDGYLLYRAEERWTKRRPDNVLLVDQLIALTHDAYAALWRFLADVDLVSTVKAEQRPGGEPLGWLLADARAVTDAERGEGLWVRLLDLPRALETRAYERADRLVIETVLHRPGGDLCERVELDASPQGARATTTTRDPDLTISLSALGAAYLGGTPLRHATLAAGADEHTPGALARADRLLRTLDPPWCSTFF